MNGLLNILYFQKHSKVKINLRFLCFFFYKILIGNIDQNQYVEKVRTLMDFIAPRILKEDIETIWKMQVKIHIVSFDDYD